MSRAELARMIEAGRLDQAAWRARAGVSPEDPGSAADAELVEWLRDTDLPRDRPAPWRAALHMSGGRRAAASSEVLGAVRRFLARGLASAVEHEEGRGGTIDGEPAGAFLLLADLPEEAAASLFVSLSRWPGSGRVALLLANALFRLGRTEEARDHYRRALRVAPLEVAIEEVEDGEVRELAALAEELGIEGDVRPWLPALGWLEDVLPLSALDPVPGDGFGPGSMAYDLLIAHKGARTHGERAAIRRDLREIAPGLLAALLGAHKLEAGPGGTA